MQPLRRWSIRCCSHLVSTRCNFTFWPICSCLHKQVYYSTKIIRAYVSFSMLVPVSNHACVASIDTLLSQSASHRLRDKLLRRNYLLLRAKRSNRAVRVACGGRFQQNRKVESVATPMFSTAFVCGSQMRGRFPISSLFMRWRTCLTVSDAGWCVVCDWLAASIAGACSKLELHWNGNATSLPLLGIL